MSIIMAEIRRF